MDCNQVLNHLLSEGNPREPNLPIDECLIDILKSASGKNDAAPKRGKNISFAPGKDISVSTEKDTESEGEQEKESEDESDMDFESEDFQKTPTSVKSTMRIMIPNKFPRPL